MNIDGVRQYQTGDEIDINQLYHKVFQKKRSGEEWSWKFSRTPRHMKPLIFVYEKKGMIVGHVAIWTMPAHIKGKERLIGLRVDTMVEPEYRRQGIYRDLTQHMLKQALQHNIVCLIGFPSKIARKKLINTEKVKTIGKVERYIKINKPLGFTKYVVSDRILKSRLKKDINQQKISLFNEPLPVGWKLERLGGFGKKLVQFIQMKAKWKSVQTKKCQQFLHWKFTDRPDKQYETIVLTYYGDIKGYAIVNCYNKGKVKIGEIVDLLAIDEPTAWQYLLYGVSRCLHYTDFIQLWICPDKMIDAYLKRQFFIKTDKPLSLVIHELDPCVKEIPLSEWWLTMGDIDSY